jgi:hypothetical protein
MSVELNVRQKPIEIELKDQKRNTVLTIKSEVETIEGVTLAVHPFIKEVGGKHVVCKSGWQCTEPRTGFRFNGSEKYSRRDAVEGAATIIRKLGLAAVERIIQEKLGGLL